MFTKPHHVPGFVTIAVNKTSDPLDPLARGGLRALCPEETRHALVFAIKRDMDRNLPVDDWLRVVLSSPVQFQAVDEVDMVWVATGLREKVGALYETVYYSNVQRVFQIMALRQRQEKLTGKRITVSEVVTLYNSKVSVSSGEAVNTGFVDSAMYVWESLLKNPLLRNLVVAVAFLNWSLVLNIVARLWFLYGFVVSRPVVGRQRSTSGRRRRSTPFTSWSSLCASRTGTPTAFPGRSLA